MTAAPTTPYVQLDHVFKRFDRHVALRDITIAIGSGEIVALLGANGAGKTTLLRIIATLSRPTRGRVVAFGVDAWTNKTEVRRRIGVVAHQPYAYPELTCRENLTFFARMWGIGSESDRVHAVLSQVGLTDRANERASALSRGLLQRLNLARAILHDPALLILDEPDTGLDAAGRDVLESLIQDRAARGGSIIFTSHHIDFALTIGTRVVVISQGQLAIDEPRHSVDSHDVIETLSAGPAGVVV